MSTRYATLFDFLGLDAAPQPPKKVRKRRARRGNHVHLTRWPGRGLMVQVRWPLPRNVTVNCGLFISEMAVRVRDLLARETPNHPRTPLGVWQALQRLFAKLQELGVHTPAVWPKYVRPIPGGFAAKVRMRGRVLEATGPFAVPEDAHAAMLELIAQEFPRPARGPTLFDVDVTDDLDVCSGPAHAFEAKSRSVA